MARIAGNDGGQGFLDLGALLLARAQRGGEFGLFAVRPRGDDLVIDADIAANHPEQAARCRRRANAIVAEYRIDIAGMSAVQQEAYPEVEILGRSEEHTSELQSLMRISDAVFCLKNKNKN